MKTNVRKFWVCIIVIAMMAQILALAPVMVSAATDLTEGGTASSSGGINPGEEPAKAFDNTTSTKWNTNTAVPLTLQYDFAGTTAYAVNRYTVASANDAPARDPKDWQFQGSNNGTTWTTLDTRTNITFASRKQTQTQTFTFTNTTGYQMYRLNITANRGDAWTQLSEVQMFTSGATPTPTPTSVTGVSVSPTSATVNVNETKQLTAIMTPTNATNKVVSWSSSNASVATVSAFGVVKGIAGGNATITATTQDGNRTATCSVNVPTPGTGVVAVRANDFLNSLGSCTHISQGQDDPTQVANALAYTGIRNIRDDFSASRVQDWINIHNQTGARLTLLSNNGNVSNTISVAEHLAAAGALLAIEGPNEPNNWSVTYEGQTSGYTTTFMPIARFQRDLYAAVRANSLLNGIPVFNSSEAGGAEPDNVGLQFNTIPAGAGTKMPDGTQYADYANVHNYICRQPDLIDNMAWLNADPDYVSWADGIYGEYGLTWHSGFAGYGATDRATLPRVTTETGWNSTADGAGVSITYDQQGRLYMNMFLSQYKKGFAHTFMYMMKDDASQDIGRAWGFYNSNWTPKVVANYMHNFTTILADTGSITPGRLNYSIPSQPALVHEMLMQKSNGKFYLAVWSEKVSGTTNVTVNLGSSFGTVKVYTPRVGTTATQTLSNVSSVPLTLDAYDVMIIEI